MNSYQRRHCIELVLLIIGLILCGLVPCKVKAERTADFTYIVQQEEHTYVSIKKYIGKGGTVTVPDSIGGYPVEKIDTGAFAASDVEKVILGNQIKEIKESAFRDCKKLETITFGDNVSAIQDFAFMGCGRLKTVNFNKNLQSIGQMAFANCTGLIKVELPANLRALYSQDEGEVYGGVFYNCSGLKEVSLGSRITVIPANTFNNCSNLTKVAMPNTVEIIGQSAFAYCGKLKTIELSQNLEKIETGAFFNCISLQVMVFPDSLETIENQENSEAGDTFGLCESLEKVVFGERLNSVPGKSFFGNNNLSAMVFYGETVIEPEAFANCDKIENVYYMGDVPALYADSFGTNENLTIRYPFGKKRGSNYQRYTLYNANEACVTAIFRTPSTTISKKVISGMPVNKPILPDRTGYRLIRWTYSSNDSNVAWDFSKSVYINFYFESQWELGTYTLSFQAEEGSLAEDETELEVTYGEAVGTLPIPTRRDYDFAGWYTKKNKAGKKYTKNTAMAGNDVTLYAGWNLNPKAPKTPALTLSEEGAYKVKILWKKDATVSGYTIYRSTSKNGTFKKIGTASGAATGYVNGGLKPGRNYYYRVRCYKLMEGQKINSAFSEKKKLYLSGKPDKPVFSVKKQSKTSTDLSWDKFADAEYVDVFYSTSSNGKYNKFATYTGSSIGCYHTKLKKNKTYYYKLRTYNVVKGKKIYSKYSKVHKVTLK